jgi:bromodomain-containing protein 7
MGWTRSSGQVEGDWSLDGDRNVPTPITMERSPSVQPQRRGPRGPYEKRRPTTTSQSNLTDATPTPDNQIIDGCLPRSFDGLGAFPAGSGWAARVLVDLKIRGASVPAVLVGTRR